MRIQILEVTPVVILQSRTHITDDEVCEIALAVSDHLARLGQFAGYNETLNCIRGELLRFLKFLGVGVEQPKAGNGDFWMNHRERLGATPYVSPLPDATYPEFSKDNLEEVCCRLAEKLAGVGVAGFVYNTVMNTLWMAVYGFCSMACSLEPSLTTEMSTREGVTLSWDNIKAKHSKV